MSFFCWFFGLSVYSALFWRVLPLFSCMITNVMITNDAFEFPYDNSVDA